MNEIRIRPRDSGDIAACVAVLAETHRVDSYPMRWPAEPEAFLTSGECLESWVAERDGEIIGHMTLGYATVERDELRGIRDLPERLAGVSRLFVAPTARRSGVGVRLLDTALRTGKTLGRTVMLSVVDDAREDGAVDFYERRGWRWIATLPADWTLPGGEPATLRYYLEPLNVSTNSST